MLRWEVSDHLGCFRFLCESWTRLFYDVLSAWCDAAHGFWDRAIANSSALRFAIHSNHIMGTAHILGISAGTLFIDLQQFYDCVDLALLMRACDVIGYPRIPLLLLVQAFLGPRTLRADGHHSNQIPVSNGFGCRLISSKPLGQSFAASCLTGPPHSLSEARCITVC